MIFGKCMSVRTWALATAAVAAISSPALAQATRTFDIPAQPLSSALEAFGAQGGTEILFDRRETEGKSAPAVRGVLAPSEALSRLLAGSSLSMRQVNATTFVVSPAPQFQGAAANGPDAIQIEEVVVTGTRIRGGDTPSPVINISAERIREEGFTDLGEVIRSIPQNFSGGQNPGIAAGAAAGGMANQNITGGSGLNLRGLGQDASLTLLNGRRLSYGGFVQAVDISAIPVEAVDRIDILADGASAVYGSDAVGGVANVILNREFTGLAIGARYGGATDGGLNTQEYTATVGASWPAGGMIATLRAASNDPIYSDQRAYTQAMFMPSTLYQGGDVYSGLISVHHSVGDLIQFRLDALATRRNIVTNTGYPTTYERNEPETTSKFIAPGVEFTLPRDWKLSVGGVWGQDETDVDYLVVTRATGSSTLARPFYGNRSRTYEAGAEGPLFALGGGDARLAIGAGFRRSDFISRNQISGTVTVDGELGSRFAYAEVSLPFVGPAQNIPGVRRLTVSGALRAEDYDGFGEVSTPKFGVIYGPTADFTLKGSWGESFKVPTLSQQFQIQNAILFPAIVLGGSGYGPNATVLYLVGGNPDLEPERARTWSASLLLHPRALPRLEAELTWFDIDYTDRVVQPLIPGQALSNPLFAEFIRYSPTAAELAAVLATATFTNATGRPLDPSQVVAIAPNLFINTARQQARGFDLSGAYRLELGDGRLTFRGSVSYLDMTRQISSADEAYDLTGTLFYPAKVSGRAGAVWSQGGFTAALFGNYRSGVTNLADDRRGGSFTTFDSTLGYNTGDRDDGLSNLRFEVSLQNLFDRAPPLYAPLTPANAPYDSTNYSAIGRFLSVSVSKRW